MPTETGRGPGWVFVGLPHKSTIDVVDGYGSKLKARQAAVVRVTTVAAATYDSVDCMLVQVDSSGVEIIEACVATQFPNGMVLQLFHFVQL